MSQEIDQLAEKNQLKDAELKVLRKMLYKGTFIYIMNIGSMFQYLFPWGNQIYQNHIFLKPKSWRKMKWGKPPYTKEEIEYGETVVLNGAIDSIDKLVEERKEIPTNK